MDQYWLLSSDTVHGAYGERRASQMALVIKNPPASPGDVRDAGLIPGLGRSPGEGNGNQLQYPCLENPLDRGLQSIGSQRVRHNCSDSVHAHKRTKVTADVKAAARDKADS